MFQQSSEKLNEFLKNKGCTVEAVMDEEETVVELRSGNSLLINLYNKSLTYNNSFTFEKIGALIDYLTQEPSEDSSSNRKYK